MARKLGTLFIFLIFVAIGFWAWSTSSSNPPQRIQSSYHMDLTKESQFFLSVCSGLDVTADIGQLAHTYCTGLIRGVASGHLITTRIAQYQQMKTPVLWCIDTNISNLELTTAVESWVGKNTPRVLELARDFKHLDLSIATVISALSTTYPCEN